MTESEKKQIEPYLQKILILLKKGAFETIQTGKVEISIRNARFEDVWVTKKN